MSISKIQQKTLSKLLDKYEKSKTFLETNRVNQTFSKAVVDLFPKYADDSEYEFFCDVNEALGELKAKKLIKISYKRGDIVDKVQLNLEQLENCYLFLGRQPKKDENVWFEEVWSEFEDCEVLRKYVACQRELLRRNRQVEYYNGNHADYIDTLQLVQALLNNEMEIYVRDFSMRLFSDSKRVEQLSVSACALLFSYGDYQEKENVLEECGVVRTPTYVYVKGKGHLVFPNQTIDLTRLPGDIAISTNTLQGLQEVIVLGSCVITVENMTSFHDFVDNDAIVVYQGGFHNKTKREFLKKMYEQNTDKKYFHFGDIDAGGFLIFEHLRRKTGIPFQTLCMDVNTLQCHQNQTKPLEGTDRKRLQKLMDTYPEHQDVIGYMLENDCKLEQEAVKVDEIEYWTICPMTN